MSHEQRLLLALGLSMLVFVVWYKLFPPPEPVTPAPASAQEPSPDGAPPSPELGQEGAPLAPEESSPDQAEEADGRWKEFLEVYRSGAPEREQGIVLSTDKFRAGFTTRGARLESFVLNEYRDAEGKPLELVYDGMNTKPMGYRLPLAVEIDGRPERTNEANRALYVSEVEEQDGEIHATFLYASEDDFYVRKLFRFHKDAYPFEVEVEAAEGGVRLPVYVRLGPGFGVDEEAESDRFYNVREFVFGFSQGGAWNVERASRENVLEAARSGEAGMLAGFLIWKRLPYAPEAEGSVRLAEAPRWAAMGDNYFSAVALSEQGFPKVRLYAATKEKKMPGEEEPLVEAEAAGLAVPADALTQLAFIPKDFRVLRPMEQRLSDLVDLGFFWWLSLPLLWLLNFFYGYVENYGVAIILVTVVVKILFHPLTHKSMVSMRRMQKLQPKIKAIQEKHRKKKKDVESRQKMNEEMMALYKKEGVNPLGGCLPLLLQMPVLFAFYSLLMVSIEIRQAPFFFWIKDLSKPDPYWVTPIVMGITMFLQQRMSQPPAAAGSELQMRMMKWMPVIFTWMFLKFPSGLVLYWLTNNVLSIVQQRWINKAADAPTPPKPAKEKGRRKKDTEKKDAENAAKA